MQRGDLGPSVAEVQSKLTECLGAKVQSDGIFGAQTEAAVKTLQSMYGLRVTGILDYKTSLVLLEQWKKSQERIGDGE